MIPVCFLGLSLVFKSKPLRVRHPNQMLISACAALVFAKGLAPDAFAAETVKAFRAGAHLVDISPTNFPVIVNAMFTERSATNAADPLYARALVRDDGVTRVAIAVVDTCMMGRELLDSAKDIASRATGIPPERMLISATHTHSAPSAMACLGSRQDTNYAVFLIPRIAEAIIGGNKHLTRARIGWAAVDDWDHTFNRSWIRRSDRILNDPFGNPTVRANMHPGYESPDVTGPTGTVDPGLTVLAVQSVEGHPKALPEIYALEALYLHDRPRTELKLQALRVGDLGIAAIPNEVYALTGLKIKEQSPFATTFNMELANGSEGYIPTPEQHVLLRCRDIALRAVGQFHIERRRKRTLLLNLQTREGIHFVRNGCDAQITNAQRLQFQFGARAVVQIKGLQRVDLRERFGHRALNGGGHLPRPSQARVIRRAVI